MVSTTIPEQKNRLIAIVPDCLAGNLDLAEQVLKTAARYHLDVYFLTLVSEEKEVLPAIHSVSDMKALAYLHGAIDAPVITISGYYHPQREQLGRWARSLAAWMGFLILLAGFAFLEIRLDGLLEGWVEKVVISAAVIAEIGAIWGWDALMEK
jgi:hypothetical protein